jgi:PAS domain S-box-containing protein
VSGFFILARFLPGSCQILWRIYDNSFLFFAPDSYFYIDSYIFASKRLYVFQARLNLIVLKMVKKKALQVIVNPPKRNISDGKTSEGHIHIEGIKGNIDDKFSVVFDVSPIAMSLATIPEGKMIDVNKAWLDLVGIPNKEDVLGKTSIELGLIPEGDSRENILNEFKQYGSVKNAEIVANTKNGERINLLVNVKVIEIRGVKHLLSTNENITQRVEMLLKNQLTFSELIERAPFGIYIVDSSFHIAQMNVGSQNGAFRNVRPVIGRELTEVMHILWPDTVAEQIISAFRHTLDTGESYYNTPFMYPRRDVEDVESYEWELHRLKLPDDQFGVICYYFDSTNLRKAKDALAFQSHLLSEVHEAVFASDSKFIINFWNPAAEQMFGWTEEEALGKISGELLKPKTDVSSLDEVRSKLRNEGYWIGEGEYLRKNGTYFFVEVNSKSLKDADGKYMGQIVVVRDITERKQAQEALLSSEARWNAAIENFGEGAIIATEDEKVIYWNPAARAMHGFKTEEEGIGPLSETPNTFELWLPDRSHLLSLDEWPMRRIKRGETVQKMELILRRPDQGWERIISYSGVIVGTASGERLIFLSLYDLTDQRNLEKSLSLSEERFRLALKNAPVSVAIQDKNLVYQWAYNQRSQSPHEIVGKTDADLFAPEDLEWMIPLKKEIIDSGKELYVEKWVTSNGKRFFLGVNYEPIRDTSGNIRGIGMATIDLTEKKVFEETLQQSERKLKKSEEKFRTVLDNSQDFIYQINLKTGCYEYVSPSVKEILGYSIEEFTVMDYNTALLMVHPDDLDIVAMGLASLNNTGQAKSEYRLLAKSGDYRWVSNHMSLLRDEEGNPLYRCGNLRDITEYKHALEVLIDNEIKLKELITTKDKFFNIIAHDLKNPFTSLIGSSELLIENIDKMRLEQVKTLAYILHASSKNGYGILLNLLDWSRSQTGMLKINPEKINLHKLVDEQILELDHISSNKEIKVISLVEEDIFLTSDKNIISTILRNLISNSLKFSNRKGSITIRDSIEESRYIISVQDNGIGISPENLVNIFKLENKLSTPGTENEQGTGLGLKLCKELIEKIGGEIWVESIENKGSIFKFSVLYNQ